MLKILFIMKETVLKNGSVVVTVVGKERTKNSKYITILKLNTLFFCQTLTIHSEGKALTQSDEIENKMKPTVVVSIIGLTK